MIKRSTRVIFIKTKKLFNIYDIDFCKILISKTEHYGKISFKYFLGYNDDVIRPLHIKIYQIIGYFNCFNSDKTMSFKVNNNRLLKKYNTKIWGKVTILMNVRFDSEPVYGDNDKYIKAKIKSHGDKVNTNRQKNTKRSCY